MKGKVNILVATGLVVLVAMFGCSGYLLFRGIRTYSSAQRKADALYRKLSAHYTANPFPSELNVETRTANARRLNEWSESLLAELQHAQQASIEHHYLGYWIAACPSMAYKNRYRPHPLLDSYVTDEQRPVWMPTVAQPAQVSE